MCYDKYSRLEIQKIASSLLGERTTLTPIGNHDLKRHLVYHLKTEKGREYVFKYYYLSKFYFREIKTLQYLQKHNIPVPKIVNHGAIDDERYWLLMTKLEGESLIKTLKDIPFNNQLALFEQMGHLLYRFHNIKFDCYSSWNEGATFQCMTLLSAYKHKLDGLIQRLRSPELPEHNILIAGIHYIEQHMDVLKTDATPVLCHQDYDARNILVIKEDGIFKISAILDFEHSIPWDAYSDFTHLYLKHFSQSPQLEVAFFKGYGLSAKQDPAFEPRFNFHLVYYCLTACTWAYDVAPDFYTLCLKTLKRIVL